MKNPLFSFAPTRVVNDVRRFYGGHLFLYRSFWICLFADSFDYKEYKTRCQKIEVELYRKQDDIWDCEIWTSIGTEIWTGEILIGTSIFGKTWKETLSKAKKFIDSRIEEDYLPWSNDNFNKTIAFSKSMFD